MFESGVITFFFIGMFVSIYLIQFLYKREAYKASNIVMVFNFVANVYCIVAGIIGISYTFINTKATFFLGKEKVDHELSVEEVKVYVSIVLLIVAVLVFFLAHWTTGETYE